MGLSEARQNDLRIFNEYAHGYALKLGDNPRRSWIDACRVHFFNSEKLR